MCGHVGQPANYSLMMNEVYETERIVSIQSEDRHVETVLQVMQAILNLMQDLIGSQCNCFRRPNEFVDRCLEPQTTSQAVAFCAR